jgi:hypothetical protein
MHVKFCSENMKRRNHADELGVDGRIILKRILDLLCEGVDFIQMPEDRAESCEHGSGPSGNSLECRTGVSFSRGTQLHVAS